jgi:hypothetical protein
MVGSSWVAAQLAASQEGLSSMKLAEDDVLSRLVPRSVAACGVCVCRFAAAASTHTRASLLVPFQAGSGQYTRGCCLWHERNGIRIACQMLPRPPNGRPLVPPTLNSFINKIRVIIAYGYVLITDRSKLCLSIRIFLSTEWITIHSWKVIWITWFANAPVRVGKRIKYRPHNWIKFFIFNALNQYVLEPLTESGQTNKRERKQHTRVRENNACTVSYTSVILLHSTYTAILRFLPHRGA